LGMEGRLRSRALRQVTRPWPFSLRLLGPPRSTLFPYTTLFRSMEKIATPMKGLRKPGRTLPWMRSAARTGSSSEALAPSALDTRSEEHTSELESRGHLVCRLLLERKHCGFWIGREQPHGLANFI